MQHRMRTNQLDQQQIEGLLEKLEIASLATLNAENGSPYVIPVHFIYHNEQIFVHGLTKGQKIDNINANSKISMTAYKMDSLLLDENKEPCDTNTKYQSIIIAGEATVLKDDQKALKTEVLKGFVAKYTPQLLENKIPEKMINGTAVIQININQITGKYYR